jgi:hypothetical protein
MRRRVPTHYARMSVHRISESQELTKTVCPRTARFSSYREHSCICPMPMNDRMTLTVRSLAAARSGGMPCQIESLAPAPPRFKKFGSKATPRPRKVFARETEPSELLLHCTVPHTETLSCPQVLLASPATNPWRRSRPESDDLLYLGEPCQKGAVPLHSGRGTLKTESLKTWIRDGRWSC